MLEDIGRLIEESRRTGIRITKLLAKEDYASKNPLFNLLPTRFLLDITPLEAITVGELRKLCEARPDHPLSAQKRMSVIGKAEHAIVYVLKEDIAALKGDTSHHPPPDTSTPADLQTVPEVDLETDLTELQEPEADPEAIELTPEDVTEAEPTAPSNSE
jgi:hypothetical protein